MREVGEGRKHGPITRRDANWAAHQHQQWAPIRAAPKPPSSDNHPKDGDNSPDNATRRPK